MKRALCLIRDSLPYRREAFLKGLGVVGYKVVPTLTSPTRDDLLVIWNRYGQSEDLAKVFDRVRAPVVVVENSYLGARLEGRWFSVSLDQHAGGGKWYPGGSERWDSLGIQLSPWREGGKETVILAQRGIGSTEVRSPNSWAENVRYRIKGGRIRPHPGKELPKVLLEEDLCNAKEVITWASTAALSALIMGIPVWYAYPKWIGAMAARPLHEYANIKEPLRDDNLRLEMFRRLAWSIWRVEEIENGEVFKHLLVRDPCYV